MKLYYFSWVRERIGKPHEEVDLPETITTIKELITWLEARGPEYAAAFEEKATINAAIDQTHVDHEAPLNKAQEIAFFPPVTGG